jgi:pimeloyl-ACP methyl ester carboxylesterase
MRDVLVRVVNERYDEALAAIRCPVDLVWGADDNVVPLGIAQSVADRLGQRARLIVVPGVGHLTPLSAPGALRSAVLEQLAGRPGPVTS